MAIEPVSFDAGMVTRKSPAILEDGELVNASGVSYAISGAVSARSARQKVNTTQYGTVNGIHRYMNYVMLTDAGSVRWKWDLDGYCSLYVPPNENFTLLGNLLKTARPRFCDFEQFIIMVNGNDKKAFTSGNWYEWCIDAPVRSPTGTAGASGNTTGAYSLYYTYYIIFPSGAAVETGPSPAGTVTTSAQKIEWSNISPCPFAGAGLTIHRKLYRYSSGMIETYFVATIADNTTTTYSDDYADATLEAGTVIGCEDYVTPPARPVDVENYMNRVFAIQDNYLYPSEPYLPFTFDWGESMKVSNDGDDLTSLIYWGDQLFMSTKKTWYRLQGGNVMTWSIKNTYAITGAINKHTVAKTPWGIVYLWYDGLYLFDGARDRCISSPYLSKTLFTTTISDASACYASFDGTHYNFHYPVAGTTLSKRLVCDFTDYPKLRFYYDDFIPTAEHYHTPTNIYYYGYNGYHYTDGGTDTIALSIQTGDKTAKNIIQQKSLEYLYYDINTGGKNVTVTIYVDDSVAQTIILNTTTRKRTRMELARKDGYRISLKIDCADAQGVTIYEPWAVSVTPTGV
jgi:hypothetical protein